MTTGVENPQRATSHFVGQNLGPKCRHCRQSEARCAWLGSCCPGCSHFLHLDARGDELKSCAGGRRRLPVEHGTERGFQQHRTRHEVPCDDCRAAHSRYVIDTKVAS